MEKRLIVAVALSFLVLLGFQFLFPKQQPSEKVQSPEVVRQAEDQAYQAKTIVEPPFQEQEAINTQVPAKEDLKTISSDRLEASFSNIGGSLKKLIYRTQKDGKEIADILYEENQPQNYIFNMNTGQIAYLNTKKFTAAMDGKNDSVEYSYTEPGAYKIIKKYSFNKSFDCIDLQIIIINLSSREQYFSYQLVGPSSIESLGDVRGHSYKEADTLIDGKIWKAKAAKNVVEKSGNIEWTGLKNRYFAFILKPFEMPRSVVLAKLPSDELSLRVNSTNYAVRPGGTIEQNFLFYAGPLEAANLSAIGYNMDKMVDYGVLGGISKALLVVLRFYHHIFKNWGVAILLLTVTINILLFPLTAKSFSSMQEMKKIQPHLQKLKEMHKDNPQKLNKETMELYRKYNINPLGGCLPMLLQMPIFIALYQGLIKSIELKGANFLWIHDLSKPEGVPLPFSLPLIGNTINILPLLMVGMMALQQKFSQVGSAGMSSDQASQQKMMMIMMPVLFGFIFYNMPAGLVLYWLTNTVLMTVEQRLISKRLEK